MGKKVQKRNDHSSKMKLVSVKDSNLLKELPGKNGMTCPHNYLALMEIMSFDAQMTAEET